MASSLASFSGFFSIVFFRFFFSFFFSLFIYFLHCADSCSLNDVIPRRTPKGEP
ncbi:uncharacterized protein DS421_12g368940 [Arachis hypogaea]|nr:uncharacterized protein DS421_12g368940 [Arachis hypogaea]